MHRHSARRPALLLGTVAMVATGLLTSSPAVGAAEVAGTPFAVNFQSEGAPVPSGHVADVGHPFDATRGYGWRAIATSLPVSIVGNGRDRNLQADQRADTLIHAQLVKGAGVTTPAKWERTVANGTYDVTVGLGDVGAYYDSDHRVTVEGVPLIASFVPDAARRTLAATTRVVVTDGAVTLDPVGGTNTKFAYVVITPITTVPATTTTTTTLPPTTTTTTAPAPTTTTTAPATTTTTTAPATTTSVLPPTSTTSTTLGVPSSGYAAWGAPSAYDGLGIYKEGGSTGMAAWHTWTGRDVNYRVVWASSNTWSSIVTDFRSVTDPTKGYRRGNDQTLIVTFGLVSKETSRGATTLEKLTNAANGGNDAAWAQIGQTMQERDLDGTYPDGRPKVVLRVGWEHNGTWYPWSSKGNEAVWAQAWRRAHDVVEQYAPDAVWSWGTSATGGTIASVEAAYPGDAYVDVIEMDVYDHWAAYAGKGGGDADPTLRPRTWAAIESGTKGVTLDWLVDMATRHHKLIGITEFGLVRQVDRTYGQIGGGDDAEFIQHMYDWMEVQAKAGRLAWANYFEVDNETGPHALWNGAAAPGTTTGSSYPAAAQRFLDLFGGF